MRPRTRHRNSPEYQPWFPPTDVTAEKTAEAPADVVAVRVSLKIVPPDHSGSVAVVAKCSRSASEKVVGTRSSCTAARARVMAVRNDIG